MSADTIRDVAVAFMTLPVTRRLEIAHQLGLDAGLDDLNVRDASLEVCRRVHNDGCFDDFVVLVKAQTPRRMGGKP